MRYFLLGCALVALVSCGSRSTRAPAGIQFASGPISEACIAAGRSGASRQLCQCIQAVANSSLNPRDQSRAAGFFADPQRAQDTRQSDALGAEAFWQRYRSFSNRAERTCAPLT